MTLHKEENLEAPKIKLDSSGIKKRKKSKLKVEVKPLGESCNITTNKKRQEAMKRRNGIESPFLHVKKVHRRSKVRTQHDTSLS